MEGIRKEILKRMKPYAPDRREEIEKQQSYINKGLPDYVTYRTIFSKCKRICNPKAQPDSDIFLKKVQGYFLEKHNEADRTKKENCYGPLIDLPIRRFITTNYDLELEMALLDKGKATCTELFGEEYDLKKLSGEKKFRLSGSKSFTQRYDCREQLSQFSLARSEASQYMIFHCHGRIDDIESCIITEEDYIKWYLQDSEEVKASQQAVDVLFGSNPLLMVGYSMGDPEFMYQLQFIHANRVNDPNRSPLFVLLSIPREAIGKHREDGKEDEVLKDICVSLYARYGAHVIPVVLKNKYSVVKKLANWKAEWEGWWKHIQAKPLVKTFTPSPTKSYFHYASLQLKEEHAFIKTKGYDDLENELIKLIDTSSKRFAVLTGPAGAGKTWSTQWFAERHSKDLLHQHLRLKKNVYFWSSYYTNDLFTGIKRALKFFEYASPKNPVRPETMFDEFEKLLDNEEALLIFDGVERLLQPSHLNNTGEGASVNYDVKRFFEIIGNSRSAFVILTSRRWPVDILPENNEDKENKDKENLDNLKKQVHLHAPECSSQDLENRQVFKDYIKGDRNKKNNCISLCSLLDGHIYCLSLIEKMLANSTDKDELIRRLLRDIISTPSDRRTERVIRTAIDKADSKFHEKQMTRRSRRSTQRGNLLLKFLERVALFMNPIEEPVIKVCLKLAKKEISEANSPGRTKGKQANDKKDPSQREVKEVIQALAEYSLLLGVGFNDKTERGYTVHPLLQGYVRKHLHHSVFSSHPSIFCRATLRPSKWSIRVQPKSG